MPEPPPLGYPVDNDPTPSQPPHPYTARRREEVPSYPRHRDYSDIYHRGTDGPKRGELSTLTRTLAVSQGDPMDGKLKWIKQWVQGTSVTHAFLEATTGTWTGTPAFTHAGHYPTSNYRPTKFFPWVPRFWHPCLLPASPDASDDF